MLVFLYISWFHIPKRFNTLANHYIVVDISSKDAKNELIKNFFLNGNSDEKNDHEQDYSNHFEGDLHVWTRHFLPGIIKRINGLQSKQLLEIFSCLFFIPLSDMENHLKQNDLASTIAKFFINSKKTEPVKKATLTIQEVDEFLDLLDSITGGSLDDQISIFTSITSKCTVNDLKMIIRLITRNFRIQNRVKYILEAVRALETDEILKTEDFSCKICHFCPIYHHDK